MPVLIVNPHAGGGRAARLLDGPDLGDLTVVRPPDPDAVAEEAARAARTGEDRVLVAGGDGTLHQAIRGLAGSACALGIVPLGRGNDLARALGVPLEPCDALRRAIEAEPRRIDLARVDGQPFAGVAALGFDGEVARFVRERAGGRAGRWTYPWAVLRTLFTFEPPRVRIDSDGGSFDGVAMLAAVANSPCYGGGMLIAPGAALDDGFLDLVVVRRVSRLRLLALFPRVYRGSHVRLPEVGLMRVRRARISVDRPLTFFADGEPLGECRDSVVEVWPHALAVAV